MDINNLAMCLLGPRRRGDDAAAKNSGLFAIPPAFAHVHKRLGGLLIKKAIEEETHGDY
jgi:hypothetical protein